MRSPTLLSLICCPSFQKRAYLSPPKRTFRGKTAIAEHVLFFTVRPCAQGLQAQTLTAAGATTSENLSSVSSSHSLAETMDLCAVTLSGLIGTQHLRVHLLLDYAQQPDSGRSNRKSSCAGMDAISKHGCAIDIISQHPVESQPEVLNFVRKFRAFL